MVKQLSNLSKATLYYLLAVGFATIVSLLTVSLDRPNLIGFVMFAPMLAVLLLVSGMWEEPGWTGFALPRLQERFATAPYGTLIATLIMAVIRTSWHLPLMLSGSVYWSDIVAIVAAQIVISWLFNASGRSVLAIMLLHLLNNIMGGEFILQWFSGADLLRLWWLLAILWSVLALGLLLFAGLPLGRKPVETLNVRLN